MRGEHKVLGLTSLILAIFSIPFLFMINPPVFVVFTIILFLYAMSFSLLYVEKPVIGTLLLLFAVFYTIGFLA